jgi:hypothetical protein
VPTGLEKLKLQEDTNFSFLSELHTGHTTDAYSPVSSYAAISSKINSQFLH